MKSSLFALFAGVAGKFGIGWLFSFFSGGFLGVLSALLTQAIALASIVAQWVLTTLLSGLDHIIKSVPAILVVLSLCWAGYGYGKFVAPAKVKVVERPVPVNNPSTSQRETRPKTVFEEIFGRQ